MVFPVPQGDHDHQPQTDADAGHDASHKDAADGRAHRRGEENHGDAGRDDGAAGGGGGRDAHRFLRRIALVDHGGNQDAADAGGVRLGGAGDAAEEHTGQDVRLSKAGGEASNQHQSEFDEAFRDAAPVHNLTSEDIEGNRQQGQGADAVENGLGDDQRGQRRSGGGGQGYETGEAGQGQAQVDGNPADNQDEYQSHQQENQRG